MVLGTQWGHWGCVQSSRPSLTDRATEGGLIEAGLTVLPLFQRDEPMSVKPLVLEPGIHGCN